MVERKRKRELGESPRERGGRNEGMRKRRRVHSAVSPRWSRSRSASREMKLRRRSPSKQTIPVEREGNWKSVLYELKQVNYKLEEFKQVNYELEELNNRICRLETILTNFANLEKKREEAEKQNKSGNCILM